MKSKIGNSEFGHAFMWPVKGKRRLRLDAIQRRFNAIKSKAAFIPERLISDCAYIKLRGPKKAAPVKAIPLKKAA